jgi:hypothetical protein
LHDGVTAGCGGGNYCPGGAVTRAQMAVLLLKARFGSGYVPPPAYGDVFIDVPAGSFAADWIEDLWRRGIAAGCGGVSFCPDAPVTRAQLAVLLLKTLMGWTYQPPSATGDVFDDISADGFAAAWIEDLAVRGITGGCSIAPPLFCPGSAATRAQVAALLVHTFALP